MQVIDFLDKAAIQFPQRDVITDGDQSWTYEQMSALTHRIANALREEIGEEWAAIATYSPNHPMLFAATYGIWRSGRVWLPLNARNSVEENVQILQLMEGKFLFYHSVFEEEIPSVKEKCPNIKRFVCIDKPGGHGPCLMDWIKDYPDRAPYSQRKATDVAFLPTTSGTTGAPKGVLISHLTLETMIAGFATSLRFDEPPVHLIAAPMTHAAGIYAMTLLPFGVKNVIIPKADPLLILETIQMQKVTTLFLTPTIIYMMLAHPQVREFDYSSLRYIVYGAAPMSVDKLKEATSVFGPVFVQVFGQTEAGMPLTLLTIEDHQAALEDPVKAKRLWSAGRETAFSRVAIMDDAGNLLPPGQNGEVVARGNVVMNGYFKNDAATAEVSTHGWHHTGDIGYLDEAGYLYLVDRKKDMIISGGFNVYPSEVEQVIWTHPAVQDCAVVGAPDDKWGEAVTAIIELKPGMTAGAAEIIALCRQKIGSVKAPKSVHFWDNLPRSTVGKVLKREIRATFWKHKERAI